MKKCEMQAHIKKDYILKFLLTDIKRLAKIGLDYIELSMKCDGISEDLIFQSDRLKQIIVNCDGALKDIEEDI